jgi:hypothetical protein
VTWSEGIGFACGALSTNIGSVPVLLYMALYVALIEQAASRRAG